MDFEKNGIRVSVVDREKEIPYEMIDSLDPRCDKQCIVPTGTPYYIHIVNNSFSDNATYDIKPIEIDTMYSTSQSNSISPGCEIKFMTIHKKDLRRPLTFYSKSSYDTENTTIDWPECSEIKLVFTKHDDKNDTDREFFQMIIKLVCTQSDEEKSKINEALNAVVKEQEEQYYLGLPNEKQFTLTLINNCTECMTYNTQQLVELDNKITNDPDNKESYLLRKDFLNSCIQDYNRSITQLKERLEQIEKELQKLH